MSERHLSLTYTLNPSTKVNESVINLKDCPNGVRGNCIFLKSLYKKYIDAYKGIFKFTYKKVKKEACTI